MTSLGLTSQPELTLDVTTRLEDYFALQTAIKALEADAAEIKKALAEAMPIEMLDAGFDTPKGRLKMVYPVTSRLDPKALLIQGVTMKQIEAATKKKPGTAYLKVTAPGQPRDEVAIAE